MCGRRCTALLEMCSLAALARGCRPAAAAAKPCCLCWCCCCSCSWAKCLAVRGSEGGPGKKPGEFGPQEPLLSDGDTPPTLDEIQSWGQSFDRLMRSAAGRKVFRDFLRGEYSEENIMFWLACEELKRETDPDAVEEKARFIYEDYISILSPKEVSLDSRVREVVNRNMVEPTPHTFDEAQLQIYTLMHRDSYPRFVNSPLYKTLARLSSAEPAPAAPANPATPAAPAACAPDMDVAPPVPATQDALAAQAASATQTAPAASSTLTASATQHASFAQPVSAAQPAPVVQTSPPVHPTTATQPVTAAQLVMVAQPAQTTQSAPAAPAVQ